MQKITPCLWFDGKAEEAMNFYTSIFKKSKIGNVMCYGDAGPEKKGTIQASTDVPALSSRSRTGCL